MLRVEEAARELLREQGVDLDALKIPEYFDEPTSWDFGLVTEVDGYLVGMIRLTELENDLVAVDQLSVHPSMSRRGIGRALLLATADLCRARGYTSITSTMFRDVVFNAPFYAEMGAIEDTLPHPAMSRRRQIEAELGLDTFGPRIIMRLIL
jgi:GNAT superfamily N-acetyltransferase